MSTMQALMTERYSRLYFNTLQDPRNTFIW